MLVYDCFVSVDLKDNGVNNVMNSTEKNDGVSGGFVEVHLTVVTLALQ